MTGITNDFIDDSEEDIEEQLPDEFYVDILTGAFIKTPTDRLAKKLLIQKVLKRLIEGYGFNRDDIEVNYKPRIRGEGNKVIDIAIFESGQSHTNETIRRIVVCEKQTLREKLRSRDEARSDCEKLTRLMEILPNASFGMWVNWQEEFLFQTTEKGRFGVNPVPLAIWPIPGEETSDLQKNGGVIQIAADSEGLGDTLSRCFLYLSSNQNVGLGDKDGFKQIALLLFAKMFDESRPVSERQFWIKGDEPFTQEGQNAIQLRIKACIDGAIAWQPDVLSQGWILTLDPSQTSRVVMELARYSLSETLPNYRTKAFRTIARNTMDGREGRYPTPLNVAEMAVQMLDPKFGERIMDCSSGTGTFLAMSATHIFKEYLATLGTSPEEASNEQILIAQKNTGVWAGRDAFGCDIDPFLAVTTRLNLLFTSGNPGNIFRIDARTFPDGDLDGIEAARPKIPLNSMDIVLVNPWFSTKETISDPAILERYDMGNLWERDEDGGFRNTGVLNTGGVPPEVIFLERALQWVKPGTGRVSILLPDGLLGNPGDEYVRWWILRHCEVLASVDLPIEPFKVTVKDYGLTPALPSLLILRRRSHEELIRTEHPEYKVFMAVVGRAGVDARGNLLFQRAPDGEELIFNEEVIERVRKGGEIQINRINRRSRRIHDELPIVSEKYKEFCSSGEVGL
jgi:type I restriction enzyme M protein